jgi:predicted transcriptional regulator
MARPSSPALTDAEARVMGVLWQQETATVNDVVAALRRKKKSVSYSTAQTILRILERKGYVAHEQLDRAFVYRPIVDERQARRRAWRHLVKRLFDNSPSLLILNVLDDEDLDEAEMARLKKLIESS